MPSRNVDFTAVPYARTDHTYLAELTEERGYSHFGVGEGLLIFGEPSVMLPHVVDHTDEINLGLCMINSITDYADPGPDGERAGLAQ